MIIIWLSVIVEDLERNNGLDRPYFMSKGLMKIFSTLSGEKISNKGNTH